MNKLIKEMAEKNISRNKLSSEIGISKPTVRKYLKQPDLFSVKKAREIAELLKVDNDYAFEKLFR
tara:strand:+ start:42 stop:236 length:195 start_codon:yes stop_codon:yes gene_type:complete